MKILVWTLAHWTAGQDCSRNDHPITGLQAWLDRMNKMIPNIGAFIASGTWSDPDKNQLRTVVEQERVVRSRGVVTVNAGVPYLGSYDYHRRHYGKCAIAAGLAYALNRDDWTILACMDTDALFGDINLDAIFKRFNNGPELVMAPSWWGEPGGPLFVLKREGAVRLAHYRKTPNLLDEKDPPLPDKLLHWESEVLKIIGLRNWFNPFPNNPCLIHQGQPSAIDWPMVSSPQSEEFKKLYHETRSILTKPVVQ